jgi:hypothetical protein
MVSIMLPETSGSRLSVLPEGTLMDHQAAAALSMHTQTLRRHSRRRMGPAAALINDNVFVDGAVALLRPNANLKAARDRGGAPAVYHKGCGDAERAKTRQQAAINLAVTIVNELGDESYSGIDGVAAQHQVRRDRIEEPEERDHD